MQLLGKFLFFGGLAGQVITLVANLYMLYGLGHQSAMFLSEPWWDTWWFAYAIFGPLIVLGVILIQMTMRR